MVISVIADGHDDELNKASGRRGMVGDSTRRNRAESSGMGGKEEARDVQCQWP